MSTVSRITPIHNKHDFDGAWNPATGHCGHNVTFSVAVFKWWNKAGGGLKRLPCIVRVKGNASDPEKVYVKARELCQRLDAGEVISQKTFSV